MTEVNNTNNTVAENPIEKTIITEMTDINLQHLLRNVLAYKETPHALFEKVTIERKDDHIVVRIKDDEFKYREIYQDHYMNYQRYYERPFKLNVKELHDLHLPFDWLEEEDFIQKVEDENDINGVILMLLILETLSMVLHDENNHPNELMLESKKLLEAYPNTYHIYYAIIYFHGFALPYTLDVECPLVLTYMEIELIKQFLEYDYPVTRKYIYHTIKNSEQTLLDSLDELDINKESEFYETTQDVIENVALVIDDPEMQAICKNIINKLLEKLPKGAPLSTNAKLLDKKQKFFI